MNKLYSPLHTATTFNKKQFLRASLFLLFIVGALQKVNAQCEANPVANQTVCNNTATATITFTGTATTFNWTNNTPSIGLAASGTGNIASFIALNPSATAVTATITVTPSNGACTGTPISFTITVNPSPPAPIIIPPFVNMCVGDPSVKLRVARGAGSTQFCSGNVNIAVPDNNQAGAANSVSVNGIPATCTITGIKAIINMPHTRVGDMVFVLKAPSGHVINLDYYLSSTGGSGVTTGFVNTVISSSVTAAALSTGSSPYTGTFKADAIGATGPLGAGGPIGMIPTTTNWATFLGSLSGGSANGTWTLGFYDGVTGEVGTLTSWCLDISYSCPIGVPTTPAVWSPAIHLYMEPTNAIPYVAGTLVDSVWVRPVLAGVYTYQVTTQSVNASPVSFTNPSPISIPIGGNAGLYPSNVSVSGLPITGARVASVVLHGVNHTRSNDIDVILVSPSGQSVILMSDVGGANAINATYTFADWASGMSQNFANTTSTYRTSNAGVPDNFPAPGPGTISTTATLSTFTGNLNGTWSLFVVDDDGSSDQGLIAAGYTINFDTVPTCTSPPTTVVVNVGQPMSITQQPVNQSICVGASASFNVVASGAGPFTYQWQISTNGGVTYINLINTAPFSGVTTSTLLINMPPLAMSGNLFRVLVNGGGSGCSGRTSTAALLTVHPLPTVTITANPLVIGPGQTTTIRSTVTPNAAATYIWYRNGTIVPGATADTILVDVNSLGDYQLKVIDVNGCTSLSNIVTIAHSFSPNLFTYPNPSGGLFQVRYYSETNSSVQRSITVYNNQGIRILSKAFTQTIPYQKIDVDVRTHGKGIYWIELRDASGKRVAINRAVVL